MNVQEERFPYHGPYTHAPHVCPDGLAQGHEHSLGERCDDLTIAGTNVLIAIVKLCI